MFELGTESAAEHAALGRLLSTLGLTNALLIGPEMAAAATECPAARHFSTKADAAAWLARHPVVNQRVLVKGSRGMALETLVELL